MEKMSQLLTSGLPSLWKLGQASLRGAAGPVGGSGTGDGGLDGEDTGGDTGGGKDAAFLPIVGSDRLSFKGRTRKAARVLPKLLLHLSHQLGALLVLEASNA